jgi:hypothetical protein
MTIEITDQMVEIGARAMCRSSRPNADPDKLTAPDRGSMEPRVLWTLYAPMMRAAITAVAPLIAAAEKEANAKLADEVQSDALMPAQVRYGAKLVADAIRAPGGQT